MKVITPALGIVTATRNGAEIMALHAVGLHRVFAGAFKQRVLARADASGSNKNSANVTTGR